MAHLKWTKGGEADLVAISADAVTLRSTVPAPPGARIEAKLASDASDANQANQTNGQAAIVKIKIHGSKRQADGSFLLEGRPIDLAKELREKLVALAPRG